MGNSWDGNEPSIFQCLLEDPVVISELRRRADQSRWNFQDMVDETAKQLLMKDPTRLTSLCNPIGYLLGTADRIIKIFDPVSLSRKRQVCRESELVDKDQALDRRINSDLGDFIEKVKSVRIDPRMRPLLDAWLTLPPGKSPVSQVARALGVTHPTARKLVKREKEVFKKTERLSMSVHCRPKELVSDMDILKGVRPVAVIDLAFKLAGKTIPVNHGYGLFSAVCRVVPALRGSLSSVSTRSAVKIFRMV